MTTSLSTHVLDTSVGLPAAGVRVALLRGRTDTRWQQLAVAATDADGRIRGFPLPAELTAGDHRLVFDTGAYLESVGVAVFFPRVTIDVMLREGEHHHVPLLLSPYGYSTYRGS